MNPFRKINQMLSSGNERSAKVKKNILASFFIKGWNVLVQLLMVPLTLHCLGAYENGVWLTISSLLLWIDNLDVGLGNGLRNKLAASLAVGDTLGARRAVSSTLAMLVGIILPVLLVLVAVIAASDTYDFLNVDPNLVGRLDLTLTLSVIFVCSTFVFKFIGNFYMGLQLPAVNNLLVALGRTLSLLGTCGIWLSGVHSLLLVAVVNTAAPFLVYLASYPVTFVRRYPELRPKWNFVTKAGVKDLFDLGVKFFLLQVSGIVLFMTTNILISRFFSPEMVTPYQIAYNYFQVLLFVLTIVCGPYWSATTDAYNRGDFAWIRQANRTLDRLTAFIVALAMLMVLVSKWVFAIWVGSEVHVPTVMMLLVAAYVLILTVSMRYSYVLNGFGTLRLQLIFTVTAAVLYVVLAFLAAHFTHSINYLLMVMCFVHLPGLVANYLQYKKIISGHASGIWIA